MAVKELDPAIRQRAIKTLSMQGNITKCAKATKLDRSTVKRIVFDKGTGEEVKVEAIEKYFTPTIKVGRKNRAA